MKIESWPIDRPIQATAAVAPGIEQWPIERLIPYARNPRKNDSVVDRMAASIREFGFKIPVLARSNGTVIDGHLRLKAARLLELKSVPVILCDEWTEAQVKAFRLLANRSVNWAEWDEELLGVELEDLRSLDLDLSLTGFDQSEISLYLNGPQFGPASEDDQGKLDELKAIVCPACGHEFHRNAH